MSARRAGLGALLLVLVGGCARGASDGPIDGTSADSDDDAAGEVAQIEAGAEPGERGGIPVLVFHQICGVACAPSDTYGITRGELGRMLRSIKRAGYETIGMPDFVRAHAGDARGLPARPVLITFDDGRLDAYHNADPVLRELGLQATMFIITASATTTPGFSMQWPQIREAAASGRWTIQLHAHAGHVQVPIAMDSAGAVTTGAFYGFRQCTPGVPQCASLESFDDWKERSERDLALGDSLLASHLGPELYTSQSFAPPYGDYGQNHSNDPAIRGELRAHLDAHFAVWFTQPSADPPFMIPSDSHEVARYRILQDTTTEDVDAWLAKHALR